MAGITLDPARVRRLVAGHHAVRPLDGSAAVAIPLHVPARGLRLVMRRLRRGSQDLSLTRHRVAAAVGQQGELEAAVSGAVACAEEGRPAAS